VYSSPAIGADGTVYVGSWNYVSSYDWKLYAIDGATGTEKWSFTTGGMNSSPAIGADGTVYVGSNDRKLYAFNSEDKSAAKPPTVRTHLPEAPLSSQPSSSKSNSHEHPRYGAYELALTLSSSISILNSNSNSNSNSKELLDIINGRFSFISSAGIVSVDVVWRDMETKIMMNDANCQSGIINYDPPSYSDIVLRKCHVDGSSSSSGSGDADSTYYYSVEVTITDTFGEQENQIEYFTSHSHPHSHAPAQGQGHDQNATVH